MMERRSFLASGLAIVFGRFLKAPATPVDGGFIVPDEFAPELLARYAGPYVPKPANIQTFTFVAKKYAVTVPVPNEMIEDVDPRVLEAALGRDLAEAITEAATRSADEHFRRRWS